MKMSVCMLDVQGFYAEDGEFIAKEVAVMRGNMVAHLLFLPPDNIVMNYRTQRFLETYFHGLKWEHGFIPYDKLTPILQDCVPHNMEVYVKGLNKKVFFERVLNRDISDLESYGCPALDSLMDTLHPTSTHVKCMFHNRRNTITKCALLQAAILQDWWNKNYESAV